MGRLGNGLPLFLRQNHRARRRRFAAAVNIRSNGPSSTHVDKWRQMLYSALEVRHQEKLRLEKRINELERDLERKNKALAEAAALLILQKKTRHLLFPEE